MVIPLKLGHRHEIAGKQSIRLHRRDRGIERRVAQPVTEAHQVLRENCLYGNVRAFGEIRFHAFGSGFVTIESIPLIEQRRDAERERTVNGAQFSLTSHRWHIYMSSNVDF